ncbi:hypothetical protein FB45DRAFT_933719 [Roridomyces roridus]|uniref:Uncharacterized protein n=1 Tax=Roridomyces roridus TaxID=1738132 RepID=A0AAD7BCK3_9AGAR|nr:hypothetical protein FB45DRAFT_933719 [Roridomyces roridus]
MAGQTIFKAQAPDMLNCTLVGQTRRGGVEYAISTVRKLFQRKPTFITHRPSGLRGVINWNDRTFTVGTEQHTWEEIQRPKGGVFSLAKEWCWSGPTYLAEQKKGQWFMSHSWGNDAPVAVLTKAKERIIGTSEPAELILSDDIEDEVERMFAVLVLVYSQADESDREM